ncbi:MFS transporter [Streptomyces sp. W16]|uniref:MFS transporter n=1 Tax=Streptomyces sp. W16 TaxID=3076631 RepID=UPI00295BBEB7|nr:MFS transporter [Streptomyces sp. W16]MDV9169077.1 MFS transporter [Streptomyces sp. W16]
MTSPHSAHTEHGHGHEQEHGHGHHHGEAPPPHPHRWWLLTLLCLAQFMLIADVTVINVALPTIGADLKLGGGALTWIVTAYTLFFGSLLLLGGRLADAVGKLRMFLTGLTVFTAASIASGLAVNGEMLIAFRSAQGVGAALLSPAAMSIITTLFHGPDRNKALGVWASIGGAGSAVGVLLGGVFVSGPGWEWIFYINVPVGLLALFGVPALLGEARALTGATEQRGGTDVLGALTLTAAPALLIFGLVQARDHGFGAVSVWLPLAAAALVAGLFYAVERTVRQPLVRLDLLARRSLVGGSLVMLAAAGLLISTFFLSSFYVQHVLGNSALKTGLVFLPVAVAISVGAHLGSQAVGRLGWRAVGVGAFVLAAVGAVLLTNLSKDSDVWTDLVPGFGLLSFGLGAAFVCATTAAMNGLPHQDMGLASGLVSTSHELGASLGVAVISAIAGAGLEGGPGVGVGGFDNAFTACAVIAVAAAVAGAVLLPAGRPDPSQGPVFAH